MKPSINDKNESGFSLVDSIIGLTLISLFFISLMMAFTYSTKSNRSNTAILQASYIAQQILEELKAKNDNMVTFNSDSIPSYLIRSKIRFDISVNDIPETELTSLPNDLLTKLKPKRITVTWKEKGLDKSLQMVNYYYLK